MESYWEVVEPIFETVDTGRGFEEFTASCKGIPRTSILLLAAHWALSEVHNGGFLQLFWNSTGILVLEAMEGFYAMGLPQMAETLSDAAGQLGDPYPRERDDRWDALLVNSGKSEEEIQEIFQKEDHLYVAFCKATSNLPFDRLDDQFLELAETENGGFQQAATNYANLSSK
jgi:hypothetical protein